MSFRHASGRMVRKLGRPFARAIGAPTWTDVRRVEAQQAQRFDEIKGALRELDERERELDERERKLDGRMYDFDARLQELATELTSVELRHEIAPLSHWLDHVPVDAQPLISVIMPTFDRSDVLPRAINSVMTQRYPRWELVIIDDGGSERLQTEAEGAADDRVRWLRVEHGGPCSARNAGLRVARGSIIAYLDDDNVMDPGWLQAVAWAFHHRADVDVLYGAFVIDDLLRVNQKGSGALPRMFLHQWNRDTLQRHNLADMSAIAHRAGLPGAVFDESLREMGDWDLLMRLTADTDPLVLPAIACYYTTDAKHRLSGGPTYNDDLKVVTSRDRPRLEETGGIPADPR